MWHIQRRQPIHPKPTSFIIEPTTDAKITRQADDSLHIQWRPQADSVSIYQYHTPTLTDPGTLIATVQQSNQIVVAQPHKQKRAYFRLIFHNNNAHTLQLTVAERYLPLDGGVNFRDIGGYKTKNGRYVRWGHLYRSGLMAHLTEADQQYLHQLNLRKVYDLRSLAEVNKRPHRLAPAPNLQQIPRPMQNNLTPWRQLRGLSIVLFRPQLLENQMLYGYTQIMLEENAAVIGDILRRVAQPNTVPTVINCTAGKDRTGMIIALLLSILDVPQETILADYTLSNKDYHQFARGLHHDIKPFRRLGITIDDLYPLLIVPAQRLERVFDHLRQQYGSIIGYLQKRAGVDDNTLQTLQDRFLD